MDVETEIKQLKEEEQEKEGGVIVCWPFCGVSSKRGATGWGICLLLVGISWLASSWTSVLWPLIFVGFGAYLLLQAKKSEA